MRKKRFSKTKKVKKVSRKMSAPIIQELQNLAEQIGNIIPATSFGKNSLCFKKIATDYGLKKDWKDQGSKRDTIFVFLRNVYKNHPKIFYKIFRENLPQGIKRRHNQGNPVLSDEIKQLDTTLRKLDVNLSKEIRDLNLPETRPTIVPPPYAFKNMIDNLALHPYLLPDCSDLFKNGHINESVRKALEKYEVYVQKKSGLTLQGTDLIANAFNGDNPLIKIADTSSKRGKGLQDGFKLLSMGTMGFWRNYCSHGDEEQMPHQDAIAIISSISHLLHYIDKSEK